MSTGFQAIVDAIEQDKEQQLQDLQAEIIEWHIEGYCTEVISQEFKVDPKIIDSIIERYWEIIDSERADERAAMRRKVRGTVLRTLGVGAFFAVTGIPLFAF